MQSLQGLITTRGRSPLLGSGGIAYFFGWQVQSFAGFLQPEQTLFSIGMPHFLHGVHPQTWHIVKPPVNSMMAVSTAPGGGKFFAGGVEAGLTS